MCSRGGVPPTPPRIASTESGICQEFCEIFWRGQGFASFEKFFINWALPTTNSHSQAKIPHSIYLALRRKRQRFTLAPIPKATKLVTLSKASSILSVLLRHKRLTCSLPCLISVRKDIILPPHTHSPRAARHNYPVTRPLGQKV